MDGDADVKTEEGVEAGESAGNNCTNPSKPMAKPSESKNPLDDDDAAHKPSNSSERNDEVLDPVADSELEVGEKSSFTDNDTVSDEGGAGRKVNSKRRKFYFSCKLSEHSRAVEVVVSNEDLLTEILFHVPAKPLLKFKSVSKHWRSLISQPQFASNHACRNPRSLLISGLYFYHWINKELKSISLHGHLSLPTLAFLDPIRIGTKSKVVDSCNGLLLFSNNGDKLDYFVCNPTTQKYIALPRHGGSGPSRYSYSYWYGEQFGAYLAFDPSKSPYYKVVVVSYESRSYLVYIYSSKTVSWKETCAIAPPGGSYRRRVFWNGAIHWMTDDTHFQFDIDAEILTETPMPKVPNILEEEKIMYFGECGGNLLLIQSREKYALGFRILEMKKDCCLWIVKCKVNLRPIRNVLFPEGSTSYDGYRVLSCLNGGNEKDFMLVLIVPGKVIAYNPNSKTMKVRHHLQGNAPAARIPCGYTYRNTYQFIESLYPL